MRTAQDVIGVAILCALALGALRSLVLLVIEWRDYQRDIGYGYGVRDGIKEGYRRGRTDVTLSQVLAVPAPGDDFTEALLSGALREPVGEDMAALLGAVQGHERAARAEAGR